MSVVVPLAIPRWQWRTVGSDLSSLFRRVPAPVSGAGRREETHLVCDRSSHAAVLEGETLRLCWKKESGPEGFELWDTILEVTAPFHPDAVARLWAAWGLPPRPQSAPFASAAALLGQAIVPCASVIPVRVVRESRSASFAGIACSIETLHIGPQATLDSFAIEHEDPSVMAQLLNELGLDPGDNINLVRALKGVLGLPAEPARKQSWPAKSNASTS